MWRSVIRLDNCNSGCKEVKKYTPVNIYNTTGLSSLSYRIGTHARFKADLLANIASEKTLSKLTARDDTDLSIALMDSWATVADVLTFYQERIANEGFLRTATERLSILEIARSIGYELRPGVAASTYLAFTMDATPISPKNAMVDAGTKVQSIPAQDEMPQVFETVEKIEARQEWNEIRPHLTEKQDLCQAIIDGSVVFDGTSASLKAGDCLLFVKTNSPIYFEKITKVEIDAALNQTHITFSPPNKNKEKINSELDQISATFSSTEISSSNASSESSKIHHIDSDTSFSRTDLETILAKSWTEPELQTFAKLNGWSVDEIVDIVNSEREREKMETSGDKVYVFRVKCGVFGNNAPLWVSLPKDNPYPDWDATVAAIVKVNTNSCGTKYGAGNLIYLDNAYAGILRDSWIVLRNSTNTYAYNISDTSEITLTDFALTARVTSLILDPGNDISTGSNLIPDSLSKFGFRDTTVYAMPEKLTLADISIKDTIEGKEIVLNSMVGGLAEGRPILVSGDLDDQPGIKRNEIVFLSSVVHFEAPMLTKLNLQNPLKYTYRRDTVKINANIANATHGETKRDIIGSGDPTQRFQQFALKHSPLTYVSSSTTSGVKSTLEIRVDGVRWNEVSSFEDLGRSDNVFIKRTSDDAKTHIITGNGISGRLPQAGQENIKAEYRVGLGSSGMLKKDQLALLMTRPLGVRGVTNPLKTTGGADPENLNDARKNAPRTVLTLDRIVSLQDFKNFAQGFDRNPYVVGWEFKNKKFTTYNSHIYYGLEKQDSAQFRRRILEVDVLASSVSKRIQKPTEQIYSSTIFLLGDMNIPKMKKDDPVYQRLTKHNMEGLSYHEHLDLGSTIYDKNDYDQLVFVKPFSNKIKMNKFGIFAWDNAVFTDLWNKTKTNPSTKTPTEFKDYAKWAISDHRVLWSLLDVSN